MPHKPSEATKATQAHDEALYCTVAGIGAWGPGFDSWEALKTLLMSTDIPTDAPLLCKTPKPDVIPANERRRAPLPVKIAVDTSWQALQAAGMQASDMACVFGSGLGDTEITDYMCRALTSDLKQLSPTKFHNSVHNAAAGYWTISTGCLKSANSIAAYHNTAGLALLEAVCQCTLHNEAVLITLFDTAAHGHYRQIFDCPESFATAIIIVPTSRDIINDATRLKLTVENGRMENPHLSLPHLQNLAHTNPAAKVLTLLDALAQPDRRRADLQIADERYISIQILGNNVLGNNEDEH